MIGLGTWLAICMLQDCEPLIRQLGAEEYEAREAAMEALIRIGPPAVPAVRRALTSRDPEIAARAKWLLREVIQPGMTIDIVVFGEPELSRTGIYVPPDGYDYIPYIGRVQLAGRTREDLQEELTSKYATLLKRPQVIVELTTPSALTSP